MSEVPLGIGVLGAGSFVAQRAVLPAIAAAPTCRLVAAASRSGAVPEPWAGAAVDDYDDVLAHPDVEAVYLPLPNGMHREWTERAAAAGKHVLCEKPLAPDAETARAMVDTCRDAGVLLAEAWMTPFHRRYADVLERARRGDLGELLAVDASFRFTIGPEASGNYRWDADQGGGALLDVGIYCLGPIVELLGDDPIGMEARQRRRRGVDAATTAVLDFDGGARGSLVCSFVDDERQQLSISGTEGSLTIGDEAFTGGVADTSVTAVAGPPVDGPADGPATAPPASSTFDVEGNDPYRAMVEAFADAVRGRSPWPRPAERSVELLELLDRIRRAASGDGEPGRPGAPAAETSSPGGGGRG